MLGIPISILGLQLGCQAFQQKRIVAPNTVKRIATSFIYTTMKLSRKAFCTCEKYVTINYAITVS